MATPINVKHEPLEVTTDEDDELTMDQLEQVVGGLDRGWWPEPRESSEPELGPGGGVAP